MSARASEMTQLKVWIPEKGEAPTLLSAGLDEEVGDLVARLCQELGYDQEFYDLTYRMVYLRKSSKLREVYLPEEAHLRLMKDFRPKKKHYGVSVILKVEGTLCSANFHPETDLWWVCEQLVASESLALEESTPVVIHDEDELIGKEALGSTRLRDIVFGLNQRAIFRFKLMNERSEAGGKATSSRFYLDELTGSLGRTSNRTTGLESTSSISTVDDRCVSFKAEADYMDTDEEQARPSLRSLLLADHRPPTFFSLRRRPRCCHIL